VSIQDSRASIKDSPASIKDSTITNYELLTSLPNFNCLIQTPANQHLAGSCES
jgi:hypothetical protein